MSYFLRELSRIDLVEITKWRNDPSLIQWLATAFRFIDQEVDINWFNSYVSNRSNNVRLAICTSDSQKIIGATYLLDIDWINRSSEFSIWIGTNSLQGKGIGEFAARRTLHHAFSDLNLHRISLTVLEDNDRALHLYKKIGFLEEGHLKQVVFKNGKYVDLIQMAILSNEYQHIDSQVGI